MWGWCEVKDRDKRREKRERQTDRQTDRHKTGEKIMQSDIRKKGVWAGGVNLTRYTTERQNPVRPRHKTRKNKTSDRTNK